MTIRAAAMDDIPPCLELLRAFLSASPYADAPIVDADLAETLAAMIAGEASTVLVADREGLVGLIGLCEVGCYWNRRQRWAQEVFWWVDPASRGAGVRLLSAARAWCRRRGVQRLALSALADDRADRMAAAYGRVGFRPTEIVFTGAP